MKRPVFGRKPPAAGPAPAQPSSPPSAMPPAPPQGGDPGQHPGHAAVLRRLREIEGAEPFARAQLAGRILFDWTCRLIANERGVRIEDLLAILASTGGFACVVAALGEPMGAEAGLMAVQGKDGQLYYFGDRPNRYLLESHTALLSLVLGAAQGRGAAVSLDMAHDAMRHVAQTVGGETFGVPRLADPHRPGDLPLNYIRFLWPKLLEILDLYEVPPAQAPAAFGFAIQRAIDAGNAIDPLLAARIVIECAVPAARFDPLRLSR